MKRYKRYIKRMRAVLSKIHLVDRCLLIFMLVLMLQSAYSLFAAVSQPADSSHIDVIIRTSAAAIFGYFLSANFCMRPDRGSQYTWSSGQALQTDKGQKGRDAPVQNRMGFEPAGTGTDAETAGTGTGTGPAGTGTDAETAGNGGKTGKGDAKGITEDENEDFQSACGLQIMTAAFIGLFCLVVLILVRNLAGGEAELGLAASPVIVQFRDFISGSVGFLIGCPTSGPSSK